MYNYFVTAKHVLTNNEGNFHKKIGIRMNTHSGGSNILWVPKDKLHIFTHHNPDVDIALFPLVPDSKIYDYRSITHTLFTNDEIISKNKIEEGTDVLFAGLFTSHIGQKRNQPIVRFGKTSLISDEKIGWKEKDKPAQMLELYLFECQSFGGNSGAPVFFKPDRLREIEAGSIMGESYYLAGIMKGFFNANSPIQVTQTDYQMSATQNSGIAAITPAYLLYEVIFCEELDKIRKDNDKKMNEEKVEEKSKDDFSSQDKTLQDSEP